MEQLRVEMERVAACVEEDEFLPADQDALRAAAIVWSQACLENFRGKLLKSGLGVSAAIADFLAELESR